MGGVTKGSNRDKQKLSKNALQNHKFGDEPAGQEDFNSLVPDQHVEADAA